MSHLNQWGQWSAFLYTRRLCAWKTDFQKSVRTLKSRWEKMSSDGGETQNKKSVFRCFPSVQNMLTRKEMLHFWNRQKHYSVSDDSQNVSFLFLSVYFRLLEFTRDIGGHLFFIFVFQMCPLYCKHCRHIFYGKFSCPPLSSFFRRYCDI